MDFVAAQIELVTTSSAPFASDYIFSWTQLVHQEVIMWSQLGKAVDQTELDELSDRRGFNQVQRRFLKEFLVEAKLWKEEVSA